MLMFKKKGNCSTIKDVIKRNHPDINDFLFPEKEPEIKNLREAADYLKKLTTEDPECLVTIVGDYDIDGIHFDYIRYPEQAKYFPDKNLYNKYGKKRPLAEWRRENINKIVNRIYN